MYIMRKCHGVSEELRSFDGTPFRINFNFSFLNLHYFKGEEIQFFPPKKIP